LSIKRQFRDFNQPPSLKKFLDTPLCGYWICIFSSVCIVIENILCILFVCRLNCLNYMCILYLKNVCRKTTNKAYSLEHNCAYKEIFQYFGISHHKLLRQNLFMVKIQSLSPSYVISNLFELNF